VQAVDTAAFVGVRPEDLRLAQAGQGRLAGRVELVESLGAETLIYLQTPRGTPFVLRQAERSSLAPGQDVGVDVDVTHLHWFDAQGRALRAA